jgi:hypothetical protein
MARSRAGEFVDSRFMARVTSFIATSVAPEDFIAVRLSGTVPSRLGMAPSFGWPCS